MKPYLSLAEEKIFGTVFIDIRDLTYALSNHATCMTVPIVQIPDISSQRYSFTVDEFENEHSI